MINSRFDFENQQPNERWMEPKTKKKLSKVKYLFKVFVQLEALLANEINESKSLHMIMQAN